MAIFFGVAAILFLLLSCFVAFAPDVLLKMDKVMTTPVFTQKEVIKNNKGIRLTLAFLFLFASFWMGVVLFTGSYKTVGQPDIQASN